jgi:hypothetical protein
VLALRRFKSFFLHDAQAGVAQLVELQLSKLAVKGSNPFARSKNENRISPCSTVAVHFLGKEGVASSILAKGSTDDDSLLHPQSRGGGRSVGQPATVRKECHVERKICPQQTAR